MHYPEPHRGLWHKGAHKTNTQKVESLHLDCGLRRGAGESHPAGRPCHTLDRTCFHDAPAAEPLGELDSNHRRARGAPATTSSYTQKLLGNRNLRLKKLGRRGDRAGDALADGDSERAAEEAADVVYHLLVEHAAQDGAAAVPREVVTSLLPWAPSELAGGAMGLRANGGPYHYGAD